jgi:catechol 2,3-dioxygenase-like lactoylglutathione lyase family enzyme
VSQKESNMAETGSSRSAETVFEGVNPILRVRSLPPSIDYYVKVLGFELDWQSPGIIASVSRGRSGIMLCEGDQGNPGTWVWIGVGDIKPLFEEYSNRGARIRHPPTNYPWAYEMQIEDPDGNVLRFGSDSIENEPFGRWRDMRGDEWVMSPDGSWTRVEEGA